MLGTKPVTSITRDDIEDVRETVAPRLMKCAHFAHFKPVLRWEGPGGEVKTTEELLASLP